MKDKRTPLISLALFGRNEWHWLKENGPYLSLP